MKLCPQNEIQVDRYSFKGFFSNVLRRMPVNFVWEKGEGGVGRAGEGAEGGGGRGGLPDTCL